MIYRVFIEGQEVDLNQKTVIAQTIQATAIGSGDITGRLTSFTNQITVPATVNNVNIFGSANQVQSSTSFPFTTKSFRILCNGIQTMTGQVVIKNSTNKEFNLQFYGDVKSFSSILGDSVLSDLDFGDSPITWDQSYMDSVRASTSGLCAPLINYGQIDDSVPTTSIGNYYLPSVGYKSIITTIIENAGYSITSTSFYASDTYFNSMVLSYSKKTWPGNPIKINQILSDEITQVEFLKDFAIKFGAYFRFSGNSVEIITLQDILSDLSTAVNWTTKNKDYGVSKKPVIQFSWSGWARENVFSYPDSEIALSGDKANGSITVSNTNIQSSRNVYDSIFYRPDRVADNSNAVAGQIFYKILTVPTQISGATTPVYDSIPTGFTFDHDPKPMLLLLKDVLVGEGPSLVYNGNVRTDFKVGFFGVNSSVAYSEAGLKWRDDPDLPSDGLGLLDRYYAKVESILQSNAKTVTNYYKLSEIDIAGLDIFTPVFDIDTYYLISKVYDFVPGRLTKVDLLKIS